MDNNIVDKEFLIKKLVKNLTESFLLHQYLIYENDSGEEYNFIAGRKRYNHYGVHYGVDYQFDKFYEIKLKQTTPTLSFWLLPFHKYFPPTYNLILSVEALGKTIRSVYTLTETEYNQLLTEYQFNFNRIVRSCLDKTVFDDEPPILEKSKYTPELPKGKKMPIKEYLKRKGHVK